MTASTKTCPDCAEEVLEEADVCRHCRHAFAGGRAAAAAYRRGWWIRLGIVTAVVVALVVFMVSEANDSERRARDNVCVEVGGPACY